MCTIYTYTPDLAEAFQAKIHGDWQRNDDGGTALFFKDGKCTMKFSSMGLNAFMSVLNTAEDYDRVFVHLRAATQGSKTIANCHGWGDRVTGTTYVMHNGILSDGKQFAVDSQQIVSNIETMGVDGALSALERANFANVFIIDERSGIYYVSKSFGGSLTTDGKGNYSTYSVYNLVTKDVERETLTAYELKTGLMLGTQDFTNKTPKFTSTSNTGFYPYREWDYDDSGYDYYHRWVDRPAKLPESKSAPVEANSIETAVKDEATGLYSYRDPETGILITMNEAILKQKLHDKCLDERIAKVTAQYNERKDADRNMWEEQLLASKARRRNRRERKVS